ncbi:MAG TPA: SDR family oxidoreductase [Candidatus Acidoferrales bacterium]|nr:SDR family oxidoreductase [Candidatus Acidoferrales bacterium]
MSLNNKVCLIVGATGAIGRAVAERFSQDSARLALTCNSESPQIEGDGRRAQGTRNYYRLDITNFEQVQSIVQRVETEFSGIDVVVNCAGVIGPIGRFEETDPSEWRRALDVNFMGAVNLARAVLPALRRRGHGKMIFFSGGGAAYGRPFFTAYSSAKTALVRFTESLAQELEGTDIQVNAVAPGPVPSRMWEEMRAAGSAGGPKLVVELDQMEKTGGASPERAAALAAFLASERSNRVTGRLISALWDNWDSIEPIMDKLADSEAWTLRRIPLEQACSR